MLTSGATVGLSPSSYDPAFGQSGDASIRAKVVQLIASVRTLMRSMWPCCPGGYRCRRRAILEFFKLLTVSSIASVPLIVLNTLIIVYELVLG